MYVDIQFGESPSLLPTLQLAHSVSQSHDQIPEKVINSLLHRQLLKSLRDLVEELAATP